MHVAVDGNRNRAVDSNSILNEPQHESMAPPRSIGVGGSLVATKANLAERALDPRADVGNEKTGTTNLAHGGGNKVTKNQLHINIVAGQLRGQSIAPLLEESLATRVRGQVRSESPAAKGAHGEDKTTLALLENRRNDLGDLERAKAVDGDDALKLVPGRFEERDGDAVALADVVDQDADIKTLDKLAEGIVVGVIVLRKVHGQGLDLDRLDRVFSGDFGGNGIELRLGSRDEDEVEALGGELRGKLLAEAIGRAGDDSPGTRLSILAQLIERQKLVCWRWSTCNDPDMAAWMRLTLVPGSTKLLKTSVRKLQSLEKTKTAPTPARAHCTG